MGQISSASPSAETGRQTRRLPLVLRRAWYGLNQAFRRRIVHLEVTPDQFTVLRNLSEAGATGLTQSELTQRMSSDPNTIASLVERMAASGLLRREPDAADRRARRLRLAPAGRGKFRRAREIARKLQEEVLAALPEGEHDRFLDQLGILAEACRAAAERE